MKNKYQKPELSKSLIFLEGNVTAESTLIHPGTTNNVVEVEDWKAEIDIDDAISW